MTKKGGKAKKIKVSKNKGTKIIVDFHEHQSVFKDVEPDWEFDMDLGILRFKTPGKVVVIPIHSTCSIVIEGLEDMKAATLKLAFPKQGEDNAQTSDQPSL